MRTIKFRGKEIESGQWVYGFYTQGSFIGTDTTRHLIDSDMLYDVIENTVGQFTGLLDKNGKEIYEGDVLMFQNSVKRVVGYEDSHRACFSLLDQHLHYSSSFGSGTYESFYCEVIGNIHDNPELLNM